MNRTHKIIVSIAAAGVGLVLAANPSNAMPWGDSLRPTFLSVPHERTEDEVTGPAAPAAPAGPAVEGTGADTAVGGSTDTAGGAPAGHDEPATTAATEPPTVPAVAPAGEPPAAAPAAESSSERPAGASDGTKEPTPPRPPATTEQPATTEPPVTTEAPREPEHPATTAPRTEERRPATLSLHCELADGAVSCSWSGPTPEGAVRQLVLRGDAAAGRGRVLMNTEQTDVRSFRDTAPEAGHTYSYVVVFLDARQATIAHANGVMITVPAAPTTPEPTTPPAPPVSEPTGDQPTNG